jgi:predicted aspartyl protease
MEAANYSDEYFPSAPVLTVSLAAPEESSTTEEFSALVDTGADGTFVPASILDKLDLPIAYMTNVSAHVGGNLHRAPVYIVDMTLLGTIHLPSVEVVGDDWGDRIILGRNVLNKLRIHLDGPNETISVSE